MPSVATDVAGAGARRQAVESAFRSLPERYLGGCRELDATYQVRLADLGHTWEIRLTAGTARVRRGATRRRPDVVLSTDAATWLALREGQLSGIEALRAGQLRVRGEIDRAVAFEAAFRLPNGRPPRIRIADVAVGRTRISTLTTGTGPDVVLLHGLGGTRASLLYAAAELSRDYRVHVPDLPGFGASAKPATGRYDAPWFADHVLRLMDELEIDRAHLVGNSMGGRIALEVGLQAPERAHALGLLCPAVAFIRRGFHPLVRLLRPELGMLPHGFRRSVVEAQFWSMFHDRSALDPALGELMVDEFLRLYGSHGARYAFLSSARNIYLDRPFGRAGFYPRLAGLEIPALFVWCDRDPLIPAAFERHVRRWLPGAEHHLLRGCGHVPQVERPEETSALLREFFRRVEAGAVRPSEGVAATLAPAGTRRRRAA